ncbi:MAG: 4-(cytidine 5'-diphospho)-2-C-methyl-D-erythritol kinase [Halioglobus sp.]
MNTTLSVLSPAKLNLFLHITGRREDGYHKLQTLFQLLDWGDTLHFSTNSSGQITLDMNDLGIPPEQNLIVRAARKLQQGSLGAHIRVDKRIPTGGGLGGGSSNAATALLALNNLWGLHLETEALIALGGELGADVPVFVAGRSAWAEGIGDILTPIDLPEQWYYVVYPGCEVSTEKIFSNGQLTRDASAIKMASFFEGDSRNDCQPIVRSLYPEVDKALNWLGNFGEAKLTGTGACIFASFASKVEAENVGRELPDKWHGVVARGINYSPVLATLK